MFTTLFVILCLVEIAALIGFLVAEKVVASFAALAAFLVIVHFGWTGFQMDLVNLIVSDIPRALTVFLAYFVIGGLYSVVRWYFRVRRKAKKMAKYRAEIDRDLNERVRQNTLRRDSERETEAEAVERFRRSHNRSGELSNLRVALIPGRHKALITGWIAFWPVDSIAFFVEEPVQRAYRALSRTYVWVSKMALQSAGLTDEANNIEE